MKNVAEVTSEFKKLCKKFNVKVYRERISYSGSTYFRIKYKQIRDFVRISDHHENNRKLPKYNILVGYDIPDHTVSRTNKHYYSEKQLINLIRDFIEAVDKNEE